MTELSEAIEILRRPKTIRERSENVLRAGMEGELQHFSIRLDRLSGAAGYVAELTREAFPDLRIPVHGRARHFQAGGIDRLRLIEDALRNLPRRERAKALLDLLVTSVLLDAGAGPRWRYRERETGLLLARSEGLAVASLRMFLEGRLSGTEERLRSISTEELAEGFQAGEENPLLGLEGRAALLRALGGAMASRPDTFGSPARVGNLLDSWEARSDRNEIEAREILSTFLEGFSSIWPSRLTLEGANLGDVFRHPSAGGEGATAGLVPFHKLSQWLTYSLVEPLESVGWRVRGLEELTGLAEYRNGGLFLDMEVLVPRHAEVTALPHPPDSEIVVEWRALTIALLDRLAEQMRKELEMDRQSLPLAKVLEGGTWRAGRKLAQERRSDASPPIRIESDGTLF